MSTPPNFADIIRLLTNNGSPMSREAALNLQRTLANDGIYSYQADLRKALKDFEIENNCKVYSADFIWSKEKASLRSTNLSGLEEPVTVLEAIIRSDLTNYERRQLLPQKFDIGRKEKLKPKERNYLEIAKAICKHKYPEIKFDGSIETFVKNTTGDISKLTGFPFAAHRNLDPDIAARVLALSVRLKKLYGPSVIGRLNPLKYREKPSLELGNHDADGPARDVGYQFADTKAYFSLNISPDRLREIDYCYSRLDQRMEAFLKKFEDQLFRNFIHSTHNESSNSFHVRLATTASGHPAFSPHDWTSKKLLLPLDEQLYCHISSLEKIHLAKFESAVLTEISISDNINPIFSSGLEYAPQTTFQEIKSDPAILESYKIHLEIATGHSIANMDFRKISKIAYNVIHKMTFGYRKSSNDKLNPMVVVACLCYAKDLFEKKGATYKAYVYGSRFFKGVISSELSGEINETHQEYIRICMHACTLYMHALCNLSPYFNEYIKYRKLFLDNIIKIFDSHDTELIRKFLKGIDSNSY